MFTKKLLGRHSNICQIKYKINGKKDEKERRWLLLTKLDETKLGYAKRNCISNRHTIYTIISGIVMSLKNCTAFLFEYCG